MHLSPARELFAQEVARHGDASAAFRLAYPRSAKWRPASVHTQASRLLAHPKVVPRVAALRKKTEVMFGWTRAIWISELTALARNNKHPVSDRIRAMTEIGKAQGYYEPEEKDPGEQAKSLVIILDSSVMREATPAVDVEALPALRDGEEVQAVQETARKSPNSGV